MTISSEPMHVCYSQINEEKRIRLPVLYQKPARACPSQQVVLIALLPAIHPPPATAIVALLPPTKPWQSVTVPAVATAVPASFAAVFPKVLRTLILCLISAQFCEGRGEGGPGGRGREDAVVWCRWLLLLGWTGVGWEHWQGGRHIGAAHLEGPSPEDNEGVLHARHFHTPAT